MVGTTLCLSDDKLSWVTRVVISIDRGFSSLGEDQIIMRQSWRGYGPSSSFYFLKAGLTEVTGVVSALYHIPNSAIWSLGEVQKNG